MAKSTGVQDLELRRRLLLAESELNRLELRQGLTQVRQATRWVSELRSGGVGGAPSWLTFAAPVAGVMAAGALLKRGTIIGRVSGMLKLAGVAYPLIRAWQRHRKSERPRSEE